MAQDDGPLVDRNRALVTAFLDAMGDGRFDDAFGLLAEDCAWFSTSARRSSTPSQMRAAVEHLTANVLQRPIKISVQAVTAQEDRVAVLGEGGSVTVDGVPYEQIYHFLFRADGDRITGIWEFLDTAHAAAVFGQGTARRLLERPATS
jgi:ketosteroid isomerase-like protein